MRQTIPATECLIVDDASEDDSLERCQRLMEKYDGPTRFIILHHTKNRGLSAARNTGTDAATGDYVLFVDGDDELTDDCVEKLMRPVLNDLSIEMVSGRYYRIADGCPLRPSERLTMTQLEEDIISSRAVRKYYYKGKLCKSAWNKLIKRDFLMRNRLYFKEGVIWEDTLWTFDVVKSLCHLYTISEVTYHYYKRPHSITTDIDMRKEYAHHWCMVYDEIANHFTEGEKGREAKYHMKGLCYRCIFIQDNKEFLRVSRKYNKALVDSHYYYDSIVLSAITYMSRFPIGKASFRFVARRMKKYFSHK